MWAPLLLSGCLNLDPFSFNGVHCSTVGPSTCDKGTWDSVCLTCEEPYDWARDYPWDTEFPGMLDGDTIRPAEDVEQHTIPSEDGLAQLDAAWLPSHGGEPLLARTTIVYNHGNYAGIEHYAPRVRLLHELGYNVLIWDYRGYGKSEPATHPTAEEFIADARTVREFVKTLAPDPDRIIVYGYSLGGVPAVEMAVTEEPCALFLEAPFTSASIIAEESGKVGWPESFLSEGLFDNARKLQSYEGPLLLMVGELDSRFPPRMQEELFENAAGPKELWELPGVRHGISDGGVPEASLADYEAKMRDFIRDNAQDCLQP
jgi:pimeloyl-ACP methyl ester carboxylesterase